MERLKLRSDQILHYVEDDLRGAVRRAINRRAPCTEKGEEIRDAILWQQVLGVARNAERVVLVSGNTKEFAGPDRALRPELVLEADALDALVSYYPTLHDFAKAHAGRIAFITTEWIAANVPLEDLAERSRDYLQKVGRDRRERLNRDLPLTRRTTHAIESVSVEDFYVYEMADATIKLDCTWEAVVDFIHEADQFQWDDPEEILPRAWGERAEHRDEVVVAIYTEGVVESEELIEWSVYGVDVLG
jgi:hypothetical protein